MLVSTLPDNGLDVGKRKKKGGDQFCDTTCGLAEALFRNTRAHSPAV